MNFKEENMEIIHLDLTALAIALVRVSLGILFLFQAYDKIFKVGLKQFYSTLISTEKVAKELSKPFLKASITVSSYIEIIGGGLLVLGLFPEFVYLILAVNIVMVILSFSYLKPIWDMQHVFPRLAMLVFLMLMSPEADLYSLNWLWKEALISF